jgi:hypothetical protein
MKGNVVLEQPNPNSLPVIPQSPKPIDCSTITYATCNIGKDKFAEIKSMAVRIQIQSNQTRLLWRAKFMG